jgi:hypothetical protein
VAFAACVRAALVSVLLAVPCVDVQVTAVVCRTCAKCWLWVGRGCECCIR